ncbi:hypothetical protein TTHERM_00051810 (macronuclear) [Tetrahymena thermophila SB210]|uniref:Uncharacterized protein n=1 Tax=Tetrahymena thermophila (strain SB210) TaxID=312017 RepID=Q23D08_TETTS|nr:hypothetical protein TTHERM_00051810 [Tetrahymena thermophila SB210]EAR94533.2 hypothetical protein TTHERM_00051810 [Tetrahymena thermophila SB210]|eukprot:XP_001014878.2 hypothetical protein TTHERM_00051810 [Tetrahymena thermophila SB210]
MNSPHSQQQQNKAKDFNSYNHINLQETYYAGANHQGGYDSNNNNNKKGNLMTEDKVLKHQRKNNQDKEQIKLDNYSAHSLREDTESKNNLDKKGYEEDVISDELSSQGNLTPNHKTIEYSQSQIEKIDSSQNVSSSQANKLTTLMDDSQDQKVNKILFMNYQDKNYIGNYNLNNKVSDNFIIQYDENESILSEQNITNQNYSSSSIPQTIQKMLNQQQLQSQQKQNYQQQTQIGQLENEKGGHQDNLLSSIKAEQRQDDAVHFQFEKSSKYFQKFLNGENLNDSSMMQSSSMLFDYPLQQRTNSKDMQSFIQDLQNQETTNLRAQLNESTQRYKQTLTQNKILIDGYEKLKQQVDDLQKQVNSYQEKQQIKDENQTNQRNKKEENSFNSPSAGKQKDDRTSHNRSASHSQKHEELQKQLQDEIVQKQNQEIESLRTKNLELMQQKAELENNIKSSNFRILELQSQLNAKDVILKEKNQEIKKLYLQNETLKLDLKHVQSFNGLLSPSTKKIQDKIGHNSIKSPKQQTSQRKGSFYSEINIQAQREKADHSQLEYQKELSVKSANIPRKVGINKIQTEQSQILKDEKFNKSMNQYYTNNSSTKNQGQNNSTTQKISIEKISSEIKQLKNSLMSTDSLLRTQRTKNQVLSEKVYQAEKIRSNLDQIPKQSSESQNINNQNQLYSRTTKPHSQNNENSQQEQDTNLSASQKINDQNKNLAATQFKTVFNNQVNQKEFQNEMDRINNKQLNETSQSEIHGASSYTPRDLSQNIPTPMRNAIPIFQEKSQYEEQQINQPIFNQESQFTLQNQTLQESRKEIVNQQIHANQNYPPNGYMNQFQQQQMYEQQLELEQQQHYDLQQQNNQQQQQHNLQQQQAQYIQGPNIQQPNYPQNQSTQKLKNLLNEQYDNFSQNSRLAVNQNIQSNQHPSQNMLYFNQQNSNNISQNQILSADQSHSQFSNLLNKRAMSSQQLYPQNVQQQPQTLNKSMQNQNQILTQTPQHQPFERQPSQNLSDIPIQDKQISNNGYQQYNKVQQVQLVPNNPYQQMFFQQRTSTPQINSQFNQITTPQSPNQLHLNQSPNQLVLNQSMQSNQYQSTNQQQNSLNNAYQIGLSQQANNPHSIYQSNNLHNHQQNSSTNYFQPTNNTLQQSQNFSQNQFQFSNYLSTFPNSQNRSSVNTISSLKGENLKKLNQQLVELELEKNLIETKIMKEQSKKYGQGLSRSAAIIDLNNKLQQINSQIEEIRYMMMEQAM